MIRVRRFVSGVLALLLLLGTLPTQLGASAPRCSCCRSERSCSCCKARRAHTTGLGFGVERRGCDKECACTVHSSPNGLGARQSSVSIIFIAQRVHLDWVAPGFRPPPLLALSGRAPPVA